MGGTEATITVAVLVVYGLCACTFKGDPNKAGESVAALWDSMGCDTIWDEQRPVHSMDTWMHLRQAYEDAVGGHSKSSISPISRGNGFGIPIEARRISDHGRGVFATKGAKEGDLVWAARNQSAHFGTGATYRKFLATIDKDLACDVLQWAYVQSDWNSNEDVMKIKGSVAQGRTDLESLSSKTFADYDPWALITVDLDEGSFMNSGGWEMGEEGNVGCNESDPKQHPVHSKTQYGCDGNMYALRDIEPGEEILCHYGDFAIENGWKWFGL